MNCSRLDWSGLQMSVDGNLKVFTLVIAVTWRRDHFAGVMYVQLLLLSQWRWKVLR